MQKLVNALIIADDEFAAKQTPKCAADVLISLGDMPDSVILEVAARCGCKEVLAVKGNHDSAAPFPNPIRDLHLKTINFGGVVFGGFCGSWKYKPKGHHLFEQEEVEHLLNDFPPVDVFIAHNSPRLIHDRDDEVHLGFIAFSNYIARASPKLFLHGHQHQNVETTIGDTRVVGVFGQRLLDLSSHNGILGSP